MQIVLIRHGEKQPDSLPEEVHQLTATGQRAKRERDSIASSSSDESNAIERFVRILADVDVRAGDELGSESVLTGDQRRRFEEWSGDLLSPLSRQGQDDLDDLAKMLERRSIRPDVFLTSAAEHARQSASILTGRLLPAQSPVALPLRGLTPHSEVASDRKLTFEDIFKEVTYHHHRDLTKMNSVVIVGNEPRLGQVLTSLTQRASRPLRHGEAVCVRAHRFQDLLDGKGIIAFRLPDLRRDDSVQEQLRHKIESKMTVSTFLAGFTFAAIVELLVKGDPSPDARRIAGAVALTLASALFVASVLIYDQLAMPQPFWSGDRRSTWWDRVLRPRGKALAESCAVDGSLYAYMIWTWQWVFYPAVLFTFLGFACVLWSTGNLALVGLGVGAVIVVIAWFALNRPKLGPD